MNCITINTDASFNDEYSVGGYAFYIKSDKLKIKMSGVLKNPKSSLECEVMAIGNALAYLLKVDVNSTRWLIINTDCTAAINKIRTPVTELDKEVHRLWQKVISRVGSKRNQFRHVKGHSKIDSPRKYVNNWCDVESRKRMRIALSERKNKS